MDWVSRHTPAQLCSRRCTAPVVESGITRRSYMMAAVSNSPVSGPCVDAGCEGASLSDTHSLVPQLWPALSLYSEHRMPQYDQCQHCTYENTLIPVSITGLYSLNYAMISIYFQYVYNSLLECNILPKLIILQWLLFRKVCSSDVHRVRTKYYGTWT